MREGFGNEIGQKYTGRERRLCPQKRIRARAKRAGTLHQHLVVTYDDGNPRGIQTAPQDWFDVTYPKNRESG